MQRFLWFDTKNTINSFLMTHFITKDLKFLLFERYYENEKTRRRLGWDTVFVNHILYLIKDLIHTSDKGLYL